MNEFTEEQAANARLAQALRELSNTVGDQHRGMAGDMPIIWPADNVRETLHKAADLLDNFIISSKASGGQ